MEGGEEVKKHVKMLQLAGVQSLLSNGGKEVPLSSIEGKMACLFFSAHWCRPCRNFTPKLVQIYTMLQTTGKNIEIIFISLDHDQTSFLDHFKSMPWLALPFNTSLRQKLCSHFGIEHIPALIPLSVTPSGALGFEGDAVKLVEEYGADAYPFSVKRRGELEAMDDARRQGGKLQELLGCKDRDYVISAEGIKISIADLTGKTVGLYFGAHWCPPCRAFTKQLMEVYNELKILRPGSFEVIFISIDRSKDEFQASLSAVPWLAIPYSDTTRQELTRIFAIKGIPALLILGLDGKVLKTDGRTAISTYGATAFPFTESRVSEVDEALRKEGDNLPRQVNDPRHGHELELDMAKAYVCDECQQKGRHWVFYCKQCNFDLHPSCVVESNVGSL
ncbi:putative nucleoredoxin 3 [Dichanthelium oligosanthes]|uniref:protein-disulfide reductase n=1 Tax=Dichanthelium oligosanthes TaxID=888268 RepID=A0A1E5V020_9POAL|nr:putative nucleoredoxin 3 [Dichanthelium oligosanthes]